MKKVLGIICVLTMALSMGGCGKKTAGTGKEPIKVAFVSNAAADFWRIARAGVRKGEKDFNVKCTFYMPAQGTATEQKSKIEDLTVTGVTGLAISPVSPANQTEMLDKVAEKMNLICMDSDAPKSKRLCYVGTDNYKAGLAAGEELKKALPNGGKVMIFVGTLDAQNAVDRSNGVKDAVKGTKVQILGILTDNTDQAKAQSNVEDTLVKHPDIAGLVGLWEYNGPAIANAVTAAGKQGKIKIVTFDENPRVLQAIKDGVVQATVVQNPFEFGYQSMRILAALARKEDAKIPPGKIIDTGVRVIKKDNVDAFWAELKKLTGKA